MKIFIALVVALLCTVAVASEAGLRWDETEGAEGYYVYWRTPDSSFNATDANFYPVCAGYYDTTPPSLIPDNTCVVRTAPRVLVTGLPDAPPVVVMALKGANEIGVSDLYSNEVRKHNQGADTPGNVRRTEPPPAPGP